MSGKPTHGNPVHITRAPSAMNNFDYKNHRKGKEFFNPKIYPAANSWNPSKDNNKPLRQSVNQAGLVVPQSTGLKRTTQTSHFQ
jgi:hypothetical protein